jgi:hypothetical protein
MIGFIRERLAIREVSVSEDRKEHHPRGKPTNMCPPCHPSSCDVGSKGKCTGKNLNEKPKTQIEESGQV